MEGQLEQVDGRWQLRFTRRLPHSREKVWRAVTEPEHLAAWFPFGIEGEREAGADLQFTVEGVEPIPGRMLAFEPPSLLEFVWADQETLRFELRPDGDGCILTLINRLSTVGKAARDAAGWHSCLDMLEAHLDGRQWPYVGRERWAQVHPGYVEQFPAEAATIGPPAGH